MNQNIPDVTQVSGLRTCVPELEQLTCFSTSWGVREEKVLLDRAVR